MWLVMVRLAPLQTPKEVPVSNHLLLLLQWVLELNILDTVDGAGVCKDVLKADKTK